MGTKKAIKRQCGSTHPLPAAWWMVFALAWPGLSLLLPRGAAGQVTPSGADGTDLATATHTVSTNRQVLVAGSLRPLPSYSVDVAPAVTQVSHLATQA